MTPSDYIMLSVAVASSATLLGMWAGFVAGYANGYASGRIDTAAELTEILREPSELRATGAC